MRLIVSCLMILLPAAAFCSPFVTVAGQARLPVVAGWEVVSDTGHYPLQLVSASGEGELLIYRSDIEHSGAVDNTSQLRQATDDVISDVILTLPDARMVSSLGYYEKNHTGFVLEFTSFDSIMDARLHHRLKTALYRTDNGDQVMFTLWGKGMTRSWEYLETPIQYMQSEFQYLETHREDVFSSGQEKWPWVLIIMALTISYLLVRRRRLNREAAEKATLH